MVRTCLVLSLGVLAATVAAQEGSVQLSLGYQWVTLSGSNQTYRSQVDEDDGLVLDQLRLRLDEGELYDSLFLSASGFGGAPSGRLFLSAQKGGRYRLSLAYQRARLVSTLLDFANPLEGKGVFPGQHQRDGVLDAFTLDVELFPNKAISPLLAYRYARERSRGTTTIHLGQDEFLLAGGHFARNHDFQAGVRIHLGFLDATLVQGWRSQDGSTGFSLFPGAGAGNNSRPVLERDVRLSSYSRTTSLETDAPYTTATVRVQPWRFLRLSGRYLWQDPEARDRVSEQAAGSLVSFKLQRFFQGLSEAGLGKVSAPDWRGEGRVELDLPAGFLLTADYSQRHRELSGWALVQDVYLAAVGFSGGEQGDVTKLLSARTALERDEKESLGTLTSPSFGPIKLWASFGTVDQEVSVSPDASEIVVPGNQAGRFQRQVDRLAAGLAFKTGPLAIHVDYRQDDADRVILRTDVTELERLRARASLQLSWLEVAFAGERVDANNQVPSNNYHLESEDWTAELRLGPFRGLELRGAYGRFQTDSAILVRRPETFEVEPSLYAEDGTLREGEVTFRRGGLAAELGYSQVDASGSRGYDFSRGFARLDVPLAQGLGLGFEAAEYQYEQPALSLANYTAKRYLFLLRYQK